MSTMQAIEFKFMGKAYLGEIIGVRNKQVAILVQGKVFTLDKDIVRFERGHWFAEIS